MLAKQINHNPFSTLGNGLRLASNYIGRNVFNSDSLGAYLEPLIQLFKPEWRHQSITAKLLSISPEGNEKSGIYSLTLAPDKNWNNFTAGQYVQITINKSGAFHTRTFTIASSPTHFEQTGEIILTIRRQSQGHITPWMQDKLAPGATLYLSQASGNFIIQDNSDTKVFIAAGSGLTPIHSILSENHQAAWFRESHLIFYTHDHSTMFYQSQLASLQSKGLKITIVFTAEEGRVTQKQLGQYIKSFTHKSYYICGPEGFIDTSNTLLRAEGVKDFQIHTEYFGSDIKRSTLNIDKLNALSEEVIRVDYLDSRKQGHYSPGTFMGDSQPSLLDIAEQEGLKPVSGCRMGVCHQCICKKKSGRVLNKKTGTLSDSGAGEIQLCISIPVGNVELEL